MSDTQYRSYHITQHTGVADSNFSVKTHPIPTPKRRQVLVRVYAASLNYRDLLIITGKYPHPYASSLIPLSDGAGQVVCVGEDVTQWKKGDRVCGAFWQRWEGGEMEDYTSECLGGSIDGMLREYALMEDYGLVAFPDHLSYEEAASTAWTALFHSDHPLTHNQTILTLGTGGAPETMGTSIRLAS